MSELPQAIALAAEIHADQVDKGGHPYILHPIRVMQDAMEVEEGSEIVGICAVLHDALEDNEKYTSNYLRKLILDQGFSGQVLDILDVLTKTPGEEYLNSYIARINESGTWAITIKLADLRDNLRIERQPSMTDKDLQRIQKYHHAYRILHPDY